MGDDIFETLLETAKLIGPPPALPPALQGATPREANMKRGDFISVIAKELTDDYRNATFTKGSLANAQVAPAVVARLRSNKVLEHSLWLLLEGFGSPEDRLNIAIRVYVGYLSAAKVIASSVSGRKNNTTTRATEIAIVDAIAQSDSLYKAGVVAAPHYKWRVLGEGIYRDGIPNGALVLEDWEDVP